MLDTGVDVGALTRWRHFIDQWTVPERPDTSEHRARLTLALQREEEADMSATQSFRLLQESLPTMERVRRDTPEKLHAIIGDVESLAEQLRTALDDEGQQGS